MLEIISQYAILVLIDIVGGVLTALIIKYFIDKRENDRHKS